VSDIDRAGLRELADSLADYGLLEQEPIPLVVQERERVDAAVKALREAAQAITDLTRERNDARAAVKSQNGVVASLRSEVTDLKEQVRKPA
jgi:hypothetical protein